MSQDRDLSANNPSPTKPDLDFSKLDKAEHDQLVKAMYEIALSEIQFANDLHFFVTNVEPWFKANAEKISKEDRLFFTDRLNAIKELYVLDGNQPLTPFLKNHPETAQLAYELEDLRIKNGIDRAKNSDTIILAVNTSNQQMEMDNETKLKILTSFESQDIKEGVKKQGEYADVFSSYDKLIQHMKNTYPQLINEHDSKLDPSAAPQALSNLFQHYPIKPIQRATKYGLLYRELQKSIPPHSKQFDDIDQTLNSINQSALDANSSRKYDSLTEGRILILYNVALENVKKQRQSYPRDQELMAAEKTISEFKNEFEKLESETKEGMNKRISNVAENNLSSLSHNEIIYSYILKNFASQSNLKKNYENLILEEQKLNNLMISRSRISNEVLTKNEIAPKELSKSILKELDQQIKESENKIKQINSTIKDNKKELAKNPTEKTKLANVEARAKQMISEKKATEKAAAMHIPSFEDEVKKYNESVDGLAQGLEVNKKIRSNFDLATLNESSILEIKLNTQKWLPFENKVSAYHEFLNEQPEMQENLEQNKECLNKIYTLHAKLRNLEKFEENLGALAQKKINITQQYSNKGFIKSFAGNKTQVKRTIARFKNDSAKTVEKLKTEINAEKNRLNKELEQENKKLGNLDQKLMEQKRKSIINAPCIINQKNAVGKNQISAQDKVNFLIDNFKHELKELLEQIKREEKTLNLRDVVDARRRIEGALELIASLDKNNNLGAHDKLDKLSDIVSGQKFSDNFITKEIAKEFYPCYDNIKQDFKVQSTQINKERITLRDKKASSPEKYSVEEILKSLNSALHNYQAILDNLKTKSDFIPEHKQAKNQDRIDRYELACKKIEKIQALNNRVTRHEMMEQIGKLSKNERLPDTMVNFLKDLQGDIKEHVKREKSELERSKQVVESGLSPRQKNPERYAPKKA